MGRLGVIFSFISSVVVTVALTTGSEIAKATSSLTWSAATSISNHVGSDIEFGNGKFLLLGGQDANRSGEVGGVRISTDGTTWTSPATPPTDRDWRYAAYGNNTWIIAAYGINTGWIAKSTDNGNTWVETNLSTSINRINALTFVNGRFMMAGLALPAYYQDILSSTNGTSWSSTNFVSCYNQNGGCNNSTFQDPAYDVAFHNGRYVVTAMRSMATSTDLVNWSPITVPQNYFGVFLSMNNGTFLVNDQWSSDVLKSTDGVTFTKIAATHRVAQTKVFGSEWFALDGGGFSSKIYRSTDGINWTMTFMDNDPDNDPNTDLISDRFIGLASNGADVVAASEGPWNPVGARTVKTTLPPEISPSTQTVSGTAGTAINSSASLTASFFQGAVSYAVTSGTLPAGLTLNSSTGVISGTPSASSSATITITGTGATFGSATTSVTFAIAAAPTTTTVTTTTTTTTTIPASNIGVSSSPAPSLVTVANQAALEAEPGEAVALINGRAVDVEVVSVPEAATPAQELRVAQNIVASISQLIPSGSTNPIRAISTSTGAELTGILVNPDNPAEKLNVPVESVKLIKAGETSAVLLAGLNQTNLPATSDAKGALEVTRGGFISARAYGLPGAESGEIVLMSTPRLLKTFTVNANGTYSGQVPLPTNIAFGSHTVVMATKNAKVSLGIKLVRTRMQFRVNKVISTRLFKNRAKVKADGGKVTISARGRCKANSKRIVMASKPGGCYITVRQAASGSYKAVFYRFTVSVVRKLPKKVAVTAKK